MKKTIIALSALVLLAAGCSNEFELTENWKDTTIVYGLLDASDTAQYIRIEKAFLDPKTSALTIAQRADSLFYSDVTVELQELTTSGSGGSFTVLQRVDANEEGFSKEAGTFAQAPNYVYKMARPLTPSSRYKLIIRKGNDQAQEVTAFTQIIGAFDITAPNPLQMVRFASGRAFQFRWEEEFDAAFYDLTLRIHYTEAPTINPSDTISKVLDWDIANNLKAGETPFGLITVEVSNGAEFYQYLASQLTVDPTLTRNITHFDVIVSAGGEALLDYIESGRATAGITSAENIPLNSNINNGIGLFSTRYTQQIRGYELAPSMRDTLKFGPYTSELGF